LRAGAFAAGIGIALAAAPSALADSGAAAPAQGASASSASPSSVAVRSAGHRQSSRARNATAPSTASITSRPRAATAVSGRLRSVAAFAAGDAVPAASPAAATGSPAAVSLRARGRDAHAVESAASTSVPTANASTGYSVVSASASAAVQAPDVFGQISAFFGLPGAPATAAPTIAAAGLFLQLQVGDLFGRSPSIAAAPTVVVTNLFREVLRADPTADQLQNYLGVWNLTGINGVVAGLYSSTAFRQLEVNNYYMEMLGRTASQFELSWGTTALTWGIPEPLYAASIAAQPEFFQGSALNGGSYGTQPSATTFVNLLYRSLLGESADPTMASVYVQQIQAGRPTGLVALEFVTSDTFREIKINEIYSVAGLVPSDPTPYVNNWYFNGGLAGITTEILTSQASVDVLSGTVVLPNMTAVRQLQQILLASYLKGATVDGIEAPPQFIDLVQKYIGVDTNGQACPGNTLCNTELLNLLRTSGTTRGIPNSSIDVQSINASVASLIPTQSEIDMEKSLRFPLRNIVENGVYPLDTYLAGGLILHPGGVILTANDGTYILDGHHRWSSIYVINPYTQVSAIDMGYVPSPQDGLKEAQMAIIARDAELNPQLVEGVNLLDPNLQQSVFNGLVEQYIYAGPDPVRTLNVFARFLGCSDKVCTDVNTADQPQKLADAQNYMWGNVKRLQTYNEPYPEVTNRAYMPQPAGNQYPPYLNPLETGAISYTVPVISYLG
jgi:hypothetical protein